MSTASEMMEPPEVVSPETGVDKIVERLKGKENTLIVEEGGETVGEIHEHSLLKMLVPEDRLDEERVIGVLGFSFDSSYVAEKARDLMKEHGVKVGPDESAEEIAFLMDREGIHAVPVVEDGETVGVVHENRLIEEI